VKIPSIKDYPKKIHLRHTTYKIRFVKRLGACGETDPNKFEIRIKKGMSRNETFRTLLHEVLHLVEFEWPVKLKHKTIWKLEAALFDLLIDNFFD